MYRSEELLASALALQHERCSPSSPVRSPPLRTGPRTGGDRRLAPANRARPSMWRTCPAPASALVRSNRRRCGPAAHPLQHLSLAMKRVGRAATGVRKLAVIAGRVRECGSSA